MVASDVGRRRRRARHFERIDVASTSDAMDVLLLRVGAAPMGRIGGFAFALRETLLSLQDLTPLVCFELGKQLSGLLVFGVLAERLGDEHPSAPEIAGSVSQYGELELGVGAKLGGHRVR